MMMVSQNSISIGCSKLVLTLLKKLLATKSMQKPMSKSAIGTKKRAIFRNHKGRGKNIEHSAFVVEYFIKEKESYMAV